MHSLHTSMYVRSHCECLVQKSSEFFAKSLQSRLAVSVAIVIQCQCLRVYCISLGIHLCVKHEHTATYYCVYMIIMAVYVQHLEIVDPFYIDSSGSSQQRHRHQIEVKYNIIKPSSFCMSGFFLFGCCCFSLVSLSVCAKIKSRERKKYRKRSTIMMGEVFVVAVFVRIYTENQHFHARVACCLASSISSFLFLFLRGAEGRASSSLALQHLIIALTHKVFTK